MKYVSEDYIIQEDTTCDGEISTSDEFILKSKYLSYKKAKKGYWEQTQKQNIIVFPTCTIINPCLEIIVVKYFQDIPKSVCNINQSQQDLKISPICITDSDHD